MENQTTSFIRLLELKKIKYVNLDNIDTGFKKPDFIILKDFERLIIELKEISYTKKEIAQSNQLKDLFKLINRLNFKFALRLVLKDKFKLNSTVIKAIYNILKKNKDYIKSASADLQIIIPENFDINKIIEYETYSLKGAITNKTITYKINNSDKIPFKFRNDNASNYIKINDKNDMNPKTWTPT